ncbi:MAG TPA: hypothetical protein VFK70_07960 [Vicinamibacteria bacterium]|nr:hypothetical protein [Vicinamibacteria bacterium]
MIRGARAGVVSPGRLRASVPPILALLCLAGVAPRAGAQDAAVAQPCREEDDPPATFAYRGVQVTISESCWKRRVGNQCEELVKGWSTNWVAAEARKAIDRMKDGECLGAGIRAAAGERMQSLQVQCRPSVVWCGQAVLNSQTITLSSIVGDKRTCFGTTMTHEMLHAHAGMDHDQRCSADVTYSCDQSCFKKNNCLECAGGVCTPGYDAVHADLCKSR